MKALNSMQKSVKKVGQTKWTDLSTGAYSLSGMFAMVATTAGRALAAVKDFAAGVLSAAATVETYAARFATLLGSEEAAASHFAKLRAYAAETPFELEGISKASTALLAFGVNAEESMQILRMLGDVAAGSGGSLEELAQIYGKANTGGKLDTADFNQLGNRGLDLRSVIRERDGISATELRKNIEAGVYKVDDLRYALQQATREGGLFFEATAKQSRTLSGQWSTLQDNITELKASLGEVLVPAAKDLLATSIKIVNTWGGALVQYFETAYGALVNMGKAARDVMSVLIKFLPPLTAAGLEYVGSAFRESIQEYRDMADKVKEIEEMTSTPIFKTSVQLAAEREITRQKELAAAASEIEAKAAERAARAAEAERKARADMRKELTADRQKRADEHDRAMFTTQDAAGQRVSLAYRFEQATGQKWGGGFGADEVALARAEDAAVKKGDVGAMAELRKLREYQSIFKETLAKEIATKNAAYEKEKRTREEADIALQRARLTLAGDEQALARWEDKQRAAHLATQYETGGMSRAEAESRAAELVATERAAANAALAAADKPTPGGVQLITGSKVAVGGGGVSLRLNDAQLQLSRKSVKLQEQQATLLGEIRDFFSRRSGTEGIPVVA